MGIPRKREKESLAPRVPFVSVCSLVACSFLILGQELEESGGFVQSAEEEAVEAEAGEFSAEIEKTAGTESLVTPLVIPFGVERGTRDVESAGEDAPLIEDLLDPEIVESLDPEPLQVAESRPAVPLAPSAGSVGVGLQDDGFLLRAGRALENYRAGDARALVLSTYMETGYDSNPFFGGVSRGSRKADAYFLIGGEAGYQHRIGEVFAELKFYGDYQQFFRSESLSNDYHEGDFSLGYEGELASLGVVAGFSNGSGTNSYYQSQVEQFVWNVGLKGSYKISGLTRLRGSYQYSERNASARFPGSPRVYDSKNHTLRLDALWRYSPLLEIGPGLRATERSGGGSERLATVGPSVNVLYELTDLVSLDATAAINWSEYSSEGRDSFLSSGIGVSYQPSNLWSLKLGVDRGVVASPAEMGAFIERSSLRLRLRRISGRNSLALGLAYSRDDRAGGSVGNVSERDYFSVDLSVGRTVLKESALSLFVNYRTLSFSGSAAGESLVVGISLDHKL